jgi:hypothetical protein
MKLGVLTLAASMALSGCNMGDAMQTTLGREIIEAAATIAALTLFIGAILIVGA